MSKTKFAILFQELYSLNYYSFYVKKRIEHACSLILDGTLVSEAGLSVCYTNLGHFSKVFKKHVGVSPSKMNGKCNANCQSFYHCMRALKNQID
ncbi:DNA-binding transcriptional regulator AraC [compost metagenome]